MSEIERNIEHSRVKPTDYARERSRELLPEIMATQKDFHEHPELGGQEFETSTKIIAYLQSLGIEIVQDHIGRPVDPEKGGTGIIAIIRGKEGGPTVALRADMDALPIQETPDHETRSRNPGVMHACGHDAHSASLMGAAKIIKELSDRGELGGDVVFLFQPSEERASQRESGAVQMVKALEKKGMREKIGAFYGLHVFSEMPRGSILLSKDVETASTSNIEIKLESPGGHIMNAYDNPNLKAIISHLNVTLNDIFRQYSEEDTALVASSETKYKGASQNVLASEATDNWVIRVKSTEYKSVAKAIREKIMQEARTAIDEHLKQINAMRELKGKDGFDPNTLKLDITVQPGYRPTVHRSPELVAGAEESAKKVIGEQLVIDPKTLGGAEDFSFYLEEFRGKEIPGVFMMVGAANPEKNIPLGVHHSPHFMVDPEVGSDMSALYATLALDYIESHTQL